MGVMKVNALCAQRCEVLCSCITDRPVLLLGRFALERTCWDPKDGELCLSRAKPAETLVEARSGSDVQIDRRIWV